jgi:hypothetical protein
LKKLSETNDVRAQKTPLAMRNDLLLPLKIRDTEGSDVMFVH